jgi:hypothetical protein
MSSSFDLHVQTTISPHNGQAYHVETYPVSSNLDHTLESAVQSQKEWIKTTLDDRIAKGRKFIVRVLLINWYLPNYITRPLGEICCSCESRSTSDI